MNLTNVVWLLVGSGLGLMFSQIMGRSRRRSIPVTAVKAPPAEAFIDELRSLQEQLRQTELAYSMAAQLSQFKGSFLARTSHELRSPLNGIIGMHQLILSDLADDQQEERDFLAQAHVSALKMVTLLDEVIDAAKVEHGTSKLEIQPTQLTNLLQNVYSLTRLQAQNCTIQLNIEYPLEEIYVSADPRRLRQGIVSLVDTAIAHLQEGQIHIFVECPPDAEACYVCINTPISIKDWAADMTPPEVKSDLPSPTSTKEVLMDLAATPFPSLGFIFAVAQSLFQSMQGHLEVRDVIGSTTDSREMSQIRCMIPLVLLEPSID